MPKTTTEMFDIKAKAEYVVEWAAKDPYGFLTTVILSLIYSIVSSECCTVLEVGQDDWGQGKGAKEEIKTSIKYCKN